MASDSVRVKRRLQVFCLTCSFAPDDVFFPVLLTASVKGTWFLVSLGVLLGIFARNSCHSGIPTALKVSVIGFTSLQFIALVHKIVLFVASTRGTIRRPNHRFMRELFLFGVVVWCCEVLWAIYNVVAVIREATDICTQLETPVTAYVVIVWLNWLELAILALIYFSCLDRCKCFCCRATFRCKVESNSTVDSHLDVSTKIQVIQTNTNIDTLHLGSICREKLCTCRRDGLNNSKSIALLDLSHAMEVLFRDFDVHYTALDRLAGWVLVQKYHTQLLRQCGSSAVTEELQEATLHFLKKKGVLKRNHEVREPQQMNESKQFTDTLLYYYWFAMAAYGWSVKVFLKPLSGICSLCRGARCSLCAGGCEDQDMDDGVQELRGSLFLKAAEVANIAGINVDDVFLGKTANDIHCPPFYVCRTTRHDEITGEKKNEVVITIRGTLSVKDVMTNFTASMRDATKCQESLVEKWFLLLMKTKLSFLGVKDAYFHTGFYKSAKVILNILRKSNVFRNLIEKENYRLVVVGHSLGAGVGAILTLLIKQKHPHWANGLHAYLYSVPGAVCSYELAEKAEELGIITSVIGAYDVVPRVSWRALTYLKILVKKALDETDLKKQEILCCGTLPTWNPPIFGRTSHPIGLIDRRSGTATPDLLELQDSLPVIRRSTWDQVSEKRRKREALLKQKEEARKVSKDNHNGDNEDVDYQDRRTEIDGTKEEESREIKEAVVSLDSVLNATLGDFQAMEEEDHLDIIATEFLQESSKLGPLMFIPGRILHIEEWGKSSTRWCGVGLLGVRCCGVRCSEGRQVQASWKAREDLTGIILHKDCLLDHSPRRTLSMLERLSEQVKHSQDHQEININGNTHQNPPQIEHETSEAQAQLPEMVTKTNSDSGNGNCFVEIHEL